jgi:hypothetical protein
MSLISLHILFKRTGKSWLYLLLLCLPFGAMAQDEDEEDTTTVMVDSGLVAPPREADNVGSTDESTEEKYTPAAPELRHVPDSVVMAMKQDKDYAYANDPSYWAKEKEKEEARSETYHKGFWDYFYELFQNGGVRTITYIILGVILVLIIYRIIVVNNLYMTGASRRRKEEVIEGEVSEIEDSNLDQKIQAAVQAKQFRPAVRLMYLKALRSLNDKGWIRYHAQSTNYEYMNQVQPYGIGSEFRFMTHVYEYVWYGEFPLTEDQFGKVYQNFQQFFNTIKA